MSALRCNISVSLDGFAAGPNQSLEDPLGEGGERLHEWALGTSSWREHHGLEGGERNADADVIDDVTAGVGAHIMGRKMFGGDGPWDESWRGWWGIAPVVLGAGERLLADVGDPKLEPVQVVASPAATHVKYRVAR